MRSADHRPALVALAAGAVLCVASVLLCHRTTLLAQLADRALGCQGCVQLHHVGWRDGRIEVLGLRVAPPREGPPDVSIGRIRAGVAPVDSLRKGALVLTGVELEAVQVTQARPHPPRPVADDARGLCLRADRVEGRGVQVFVGGDEVRPAVSMRDGAAALRGFQWCPARRTWRGVGAARIGRLDVGQSRAHAVAVPGAALLGRGLALFGGQWRLGEVVGAGRGTISRIDGRARVHLGLTIDDQQVAELIEAATGTPSPLSGRARVRLDLHSGGDLPVGGAYWGVRGRIGQAVLRTADELPLAARAGIALTPWIRLRDGAAHMGAVDMQLRLGRAWAELDCVQQVGDRDARLMAWGRLAPGGGTEVFLAGAGSVLDAQGAPRVPALRIGDGGRAQVVLRQALDAGIQPRCG